MSLIKKSNMNLIAHRRNTIDKLLSTDLKYGVEVDIRSFQDRLIIHHDPYVDGEDFKSWLENYQHKTLILNIKEEGLEEELIKIMLEHGIEDYFFLDQSFPFLVKWSNNGEKRCAVRVSEYESINTALSLAGKVSWIWLDCFSKFPLDSSEVNELKRAGFSICLVSPELQGRDPEKEIPLYADIILKDKLGIDAICTKQMMTWEKELSL